MDKNNKTNYDLTKENKTMTKYNLFIRRYSRSINFDTLEELKAEVSCYFTPREIKDGIVDRLTDVNRATLKCGYKSNSYQDMEVNFYKFDEEGNCVW